MLPKNETINKAFEADNQDSRIADVKAKADNNNLSMGNFLTNNKNDKNNQKSSEESQEVADSEETIDADK